jgi:hypothetical protein
MFTLCPPPFSNSLYPTTSAMHPVTPLFRKKVRFSARWLACLPILVLFSGCQFHYRSHSSERVETTIGGTHNVRDVSNGTTRTINYSGEVVIDRGRIEQISPGCVIHITETSFGKKRVAEVREKNGKPVLWMKSGGGFRLGTSRDLAWLEKFLWSLGTSSSEAGTVEARIKRRMADPEDGDFLAPLGKLSHGSDKVAVLKSVVGCAHLTSRQQVAVIQACFQHLSFSSDRTPVLLSLVRRPDFSAAAKNALLDRVESLSFDSDRSAVLRALSAK